MINILVSRKSKLLESQMISKIKPMIQPNDKVAILGFSFFEKQIKDKDDWEKYYGVNSEYHNDCELIFTQLGVKKENIVWLNYFSSTKEELIETLSESQILFLPGGAPDEMMERIHEKEITETLEQFNGLIIGSSAGAMIQFNYFHISKDNDYKAFNICDGLGYLKDFSIEVHYKRKKVQKSGMKKASKIFKRDVYILPDDAAIICQNGQITLIDGARKIYHKGKKI
ncbi:MAG: type 1 glutamine amidotransferase-like domain-containing protein [Candidatus Phytoplasma sp.]|nr:type 1 glutamine amidotransferase-like domain-containing protein [Phytoplasma sp.]